MIKTQETKRYATGMIILNLIAFISLIGFAITYLLQYYHNLNTSEPYLFLLVENQTNIMIGWAILFLVSMILIFYINREPKPQLDYDTELWILDD